MLEMIFQEMEGLSLGERRELIRATKAAMTRELAATWGAFVESTLAGRSLRECAGDCRVCLCTSWFMRTGLCEVMARSLLALLPLRDSSRYVPLTCYDTEGPVPSDQTLG